MRRGPYNAAQILRARLWLLLVSALTALVIKAGSSSAQSRPQLGVSQYNHGLIVAAPSRTTYSQRSGLRLIVDSRWPNNYGYRPIRLTVSSAQPTKAEHRIAFRLRMVAWENLGLEVEQSFDMPRGATEVQAVVRLPQYYFDGSSKWDVWVDGTRDPELSAGNIHSPDFDVFGSPRSLGAPLCFLIVNPDARPEYLSESRSAPIASTTFSLADLPTHWIDFTAVDVVVLAPNELAQLEASRPEAMTALRRWLRAGGQVWIHSVGENWEHLEELEGALEIDSARVLPPVSADESAPESESDRNAHERGWKPIPIGPRELTADATVRHVPTGRVRTVTDPTLIERLKLDADYEIIESAVSTVPGAAVTESVDSARWYLQRPAGLGQARIFRGAWDPVGFSISWQMLGGGAPNQSPFDSPPSTPVTEAVETTSDWTQRHGLTPDMANADFADFLIPGVGLAPVTEFRVLITLFVLVIGPLNYWLLMRANRLHLLLLTVPALALGLTAMLFCYAMISDGLSTKVRVRSFTSLDQSTGEAACWARLSYYAALAPGNGLALADDVAIYPILSGWDGAGEGDSDDLRTLEWRDGRQLLLTGWLRSRVPTQYLSVRSRKSTARIDFERSGDKLAMVNQLGAKIDYLAVVDESGNAFAGEAIEVRGRYELEPSTHSDVLRRLRELVLANQPEMPPQLVSRHDRDSISERRRRRLFRQGIEPEDGLELLSENLLNKSIADLTASTADGVLNVPRRSYIAITAAGPEVDLGLSDVEEEASFHVILGSWQ